MGWGLGGEARRSEPPTACPRQEQTFLHVFGACSLAVPELPGANKFHLDQGSRSDRRICAVLARVVQRPAFPDFPMQPQRRAETKSRGEKTLSAPQSIEVFCTRPSPDLSKRIHSLCTPSSAAGISPWLPPLQQPEGPPRGLRTRLPGRVNRELTRFWLLSGSLVGPSRATILTAKHAPQICLQPGEARKLPI